MQTEFIQYFQAEQKDIPTIIDCRQTMFREMNADPAKDETAWTENLQQYFTETLNKIYFAWIAQADDKIAGTGGFYIKTQPGSPKNPSGKIAYIMGMYTKPEFRRRGICTKILRLIMQKAQELGITMFEMHATEAGVAVYIKQGFHKHPDPTYRKYI